jgi:hypothetical protein
MPGQKPQYDVMIPVEFRTADKKMATKWNPVGAAWVNDKGVITFNIITMPGVRFVLVEKQEGAS